MTKIEKYNACRDFFDKLANLLEDRYELVFSCNNDISAYLVPLGMANKITYLSKPAFSFRISDHWNWYANTNKCPREDYIQCWSKDLPYPRKRMAKGKPTKPRQAYQVALTTSGSAYRAVFGEVWNRKTKSWEWLENTPEEVMSLV